MFSSVDIVESEDSVARNEATQIARGNKEEATAVGSARVFACDWSDASEPAIALGSDQEHSGSLYQKRDEIAALLAQSKDPEHMLAAALIGFDRKSKEHFAAMEKALAADPNNPLILWNFLHACSLTLEEAVCQAKRIEKRAGLSDGGNGALWGRLAGYRLRRGDTTGAFDALIKANTAPQFNRYFIEHVGVLERGFAAATDIAYRERIIGGIGMTVGTTSDLTGVYKGCMVQAPESAEWLQACTEYGKRLERDGRTTLSTLIGIGIQKKMYEMSGDAQKVVDADFRRRLITDIMHSGNSSDDEVLLLFDDQVMADFIAEWSAHGELRAMQFVKEEVVRLSQQPGYDPCKLNSARKSATNDLIVKKHRFYLSAWAISAAHRRRRGCSAICWVARRRSWMWR